MKNTSILTIIGIVLGVIALLTSFIPIINNGSFILGIIGLVLSVVGLIKSQKKMLSILSIIICIASCGLVLSSQASLSQSLDDTSKNISGNNTEKLLKENVDVTIGTFTAKKEDFITKTTLPVTIKNKSNEKKSYHIEIEAVDEKGTRIAQDTVYVNDLNPNQSGEYKVFEYVSSDKLSALKKAKFKVASISMY